MKTAEIASHARRGTLYLLIEEPTRELLSRLLIASAALDRGFDVVLGQQWLIADNFSGLPRGLTLFKGNNRIQVRMMRQAKKAGHFVASIEEEVLGAATDIEIVRNYDPTIGHCCDLFLAQGEHQRSSLADRFPELAQRIAVTGNPRIDILGRRYDAGLAEDANLISERLGRFLLITTNFATVNPKLMDACAVFHNCANVGLIDADDPAGLEEFVSWANWERDNLAVTARLIRHLSEHCPELAVVVRPHPAENANKWRAALCDRKGVVVNDDSDHLPWISAAHMVLHTSCTTGLESFLLGRPTISLSAGDRRWNDIFVSNVVSTNYRDHLAAAAAVARHWDGSDEFRNGRADHTKSLAYFHRSEADHSAADSIVGALESHAGDFLAGQVDPSSIGRLLGDFRGEGRHQQKGEIPTAEVAHKLSRIRRAEGKSTAFRIEALAPSIIRIAAADGQSAIGSP